MNVFNWVIWEGHSEKVTFVFCCCFNFVLAMLGLHCCAQALSSCHESGLLLVAVPWLSIVVASRFGVPFSIWDPPRLGSELVSPALAVDS